MQRKLRAASEASAANEASRQVLLCALQNTGNRLKATEYKAVKMVTAAHSAQVLLAVERERRNEAVHREQRAEEARLARQRAEGVNAQLQLTDEVRPESADDAVAAHKQLIGSGATDNASC